MSDFNLEICNKRGANRFAHRPCRLPWLVPPDLKSEIWMPMMMMMMMMIIIIIKFCICSDDDYSCNSFTPLLGTIGFPLLQHLGSHACESQLPKSFLKISNDISSSGLQVAGCCLWSCLSFFIFCDVHCTSTLMNFSEMWWYFKK